MGPSLGRVGEWAGAAPHGLQHFRLHVVLGFGGMGLFLPHPATQCS